MSYVKLTVKAGKTVEVKKYYTYLYHNPGGREKRTQPTPESQRKLNQRKAADNLRWILNENFEDGDLLLTFTFKENPPENSEEMQKIMAKFFRRLRTANKDVKYVYVKEIGPRGSRHAHAVITYTELKILKKFWPYGSIQAEQLYTNGQYRKIAEYFIKYAAKTEQTEGALTGKRWYGSRNLSKPKITKKKISSKEFREEARIPKGIYLEKDSEIKGISEFTGFEYYGYTMIRTDKEGGGG